MEPNVSELQAMFFIYSYALIVGIIFYLIASIGYYKIFQKAGVDGWKGFVPILNLYCLSEIVFGKGFYFLALFIPFVGGIFYLFLNYKLAKCFRKGFLFFLGLVFFPYIFSLILGFGKSKYYGPEQLNL